MECLRKRQYRPENREPGKGEPWDGAFSEERLAEIRIEKPDGEIYRRIRERWDDVAKPLYGMGKWEELIARIGAIAGEERIRLDQKCLVVLCADNGIVAEGVSQCGQEVTLAAAKSLVRGSSCAGRMAEAAGAEILCVDIGMNCEEEIPGLLSARIRKGTKNFLKEPAMTKKEALAALFTGVELARSCREKGFDLLAAGELGIGNTTAASAVTAALLGCDAASVTGRGAGLSREGLARKRRAVALAVEKYGLTKADPLTVLAAVGSLDMAGIAGLCAGAALFRIPVVLDGVVSLAAALVAERLWPGVKEYLLPSHRGKEPASQRLLEALGFSPVITADMALGEGTGALMMFPLLDMALKVYAQGAAFSGIGIEPYRRYE